MAILRQQIDAFAVLNGPPRPVGLPSATLGAFQTYSNAQRLFAEGKAAEAATEFRKVVAMKYAGIAARPFAYVGLARSLSMVGDSAGAGKAYEDFFEYWKDADPDIALLVAARKEYAALK